MGMLDAKLGRLDWSSAEEATDTRRQGDGEGTCPIKQRGMRFWGHYSTRIRRIKKLLSSKEHSFAQILSYNNQSLTLNLYKPDPLPHSSS
ncbi:hypothetical protein WN48_07547 [Eufriesea mexicana]|uniref:Uncharacterized protein n=1 Tax=Eufriesea mexicana TaxID=516756 RepID=A0A310SJC8_9HYME|nr:hypothetical protein WN48_07547 [Eufriesea mexicana]